MKAISTSRLRDNLLKALAISAVAAVPGAVFVPAALASPDPTPQKPPVDCKLGFTGGNGTAAHPFLISNEEGLAGINDCLLYHQYFYYKLTQDIVLKPGYDGYTWDTIADGWTPIGTTRGNYFTGSIRGSDNLNNYDFPFTGVFDGGHHTISNLNVDAQDDSWGLFGLTQNAVIKNLNVEADVQTNGYDHVGAVVGEATYSNNGSDRQSAGEDSFYLGSYSLGNNGYALYIPDNFGTTVTDVTVDASMGSYYSSYAGMAVGGAYGSTVNNVSTKGEFSLFGSYDVGGVVGDTSDSTLSNLSSSATIGNNGGAYNLSSDIGGVVGRAQGSSTISKASFSGTVSGIYELGGIVGYTEYSSVTDATVTSAAKVTADNSWDNTFGIGGVVGQSYRTSINNANFAGTVSAAMLPTDDTYDVGGIVGHIDGNGDPTTLSNSTVSKSAKIIVNGDSGSSDVGGIAGWASGVAFSNDINHANLSVIDSERVGGIVGYVGPDSITSIDHSLNTGNVSVSEVNNYGDNFGGLVGYNEEVLSISNSGNQGDVTVTSVAGNNPENVGGIIGDTYTTTVTDSYNTGDLTGWNTVAGIIAYAEDARTTVHGSYNAGAVTAETNGSELSDGIANGEFGDVTANNTVLDGTGIRNRTGANLLTAAQLKSTSVLSDNGWDVGASKTWNLDGATNAYNGGFPFLSWEFTPTVAPAPSGSPTADPGTSHTYTAVSFAKNSYKLSTSAKNYLASVAESIKSAGYTTVTIDGYAKAKVTAKVTNRRNSAVKSYLQSAGVTATFTVHQNLVGSHVADTVVVSAAN